MVDKYEKQNVPAIMVGISGIFGLVLGVGSMLLLEIPYNLILTYSIMVSVLIIIGIVICFKFYPKTWYIYSKYFKE